MRVQSQPYRKWAVAVACSSFIAHSSFAPNPPTTRQERSLSGIVVDSSGSRIGFANVQLGNGSRRVVANDTGFFRLGGVPNGRFRVTVRRIGFSPSDVTFDAAPDTVVRITLEATARILGERVIRATAMRADHRGFYSRIADVQNGINHGYFVTPEEIEIRKPGWITQMIEGLPGVQVLRNPMNPRKSSIHGTTRAGMSPEPCKMTVFLDGIRITNRLGDEVEGIDEIVHSRSISGIEVYPRAVGAPPQFQPLNGSCGVVLLWTK
jgi:hypothetical protein